MRKCILTCLALLMSSTAMAQTILDSPTDKLRIEWPAPTVSTDNLDAPTGIRVRAVNPTSTGVVIRTWDVGPTVRSLTLEPAQLPDGLFSVTVAPFNGMGVAAETAPVGPFGKATAPKSLGTATGSVVEGGSASLVKPVSGEVPVISTLTSTASTTATSLGDSALSYAYPMGVNVLSSNSSRRGTPSDSASQTSSRPVKPTHSR